jgi:glutamine cyclotransferase
MGGSIALRHKSMIRPVLIACCLVLLLVRAGLPDGPGLFPPSPPHGSVYAAPAPDPSDVPVYGYRVIRAYPHDPAAFTQGLAWADGFLYEGTGLEGRSSLRKVDLKTGRVLKIRRLGAEHFGEGVTLCRDRLVQLTWQSRVGFVYDRNLRQTGQFAYATEGWGIACDGARLIMSDGTAVLRWLDARTFEVVRQATVTDRGRPVARLNELEFVKGEILANVWGTDTIARISPESGRVTGWIDLRGLSGQLGPNAEIDVLNGIAYDRRGDRLFVTGKFWPKLFEIRLVRP